MYCFHGNPSSHSIILQPCLSGVILLLHWFPYSPPFMPPSEYTPGLSRHLEPQVCFCHQFVEQCVWFQVVAQKRNKRQYFCLEELGKASWGKEIFKEREACGEKPMNGDDTR